MPSVLDQAHYRYVCVFWLSIIKHNFSPLCYVSPLHTDADDRYTCSYETMQTENYRRSVGGA
jgi:hypothetical protein